MNQSVAHIRHLTHISGGIVLKDKLKKFLPSATFDLLLSARHRIQSRREYALDRQRYVRYSLPGEATSRKVSGRNLEAQLTKDYHRIEKGLALPVPKRPFGREVMNRLSTHIETARSSNGSAALLNHSQSAYAALTAWNEDGVIVDDVAPRSLTSPSLGLQDPEGFFNTRHSCRHFSGREVDTDVLERAVSLALSTPSVCNRQAWQIRHFTQPIASQLLQFQSGNAGFTDNIPNLAIITVDAGLFAGPGERNQPWIEGGLFAMTYAWALHSLGVQSCMLNMSTGNGTADKLRIAAEIPDSELVIMMIAVGYGALEHRVARSPRRRVENVMISQRTVSSTQE